MLLKDIIFVAVLIALANSSISSKIKSQTLGEYRVQPPSHATVDKNGKYYLCLEEENYSTYQLPSRKPWGSSDTNVKTTFNRIRFNPWTLKVHTGDFTHAESTGYVGHHKTSKVPFGTAFGCQSSRNADGVAVIDLRGTLYAVDDTFKDSGYLSAGSAVVSENGQKVVLRGGGYCGWIAPKDANGEVVAHQGGWHLQLKLLPAGTGKYWRDLLFEDEVGNFYINLDPKTNTSGYKLPSRKPWGSTDSDLTLNWSKLRINPDTLEVHTGDYKYTKATGKVSHDNGYHQKVAFGTARGCQSANNADGTAHINLRGTPFRFKADNGFVKSGFQPAGSITVSSDRQQATIRGGGYCGWMAAISGNKGFQGDWADFIELLPEFDISN
mmetsp:Transcript_25544/g.26631  ORF Transcript_25544/g.26631 Transcript_25544/m.26631 type:complete len:382 (+) Transcript_25544:69-1214(+)|eukprot:CAMPEP_0170518844 /NCGR_PEP_ID=MMETSP0209-20121228/4444_1 /TAXON_ID=665100 ORGANISM="Litonotus pictus, Strain P1" /NCGR_SAMPLE_ID=MMETSP0209 /ASSEMBLY_ACC=CAM_ASM_000301 /LENGTH=381 /DNA_ID=CAMNT_0010804553 /DNA_START=19 /DNA_END=1164 /DNA_ORIENTATION=-